MYSAALGVHSWIRWGVILLGLLAVVRAVAALGGRRWTPADDRSGLLFTVALDLQFLVGIVLYFALSPLTKTAMQNMGAAMQSSAIRYWVVEHPFGMLIALVLAHVGRARVRRVPEPKKARTALIFFALALLLILGLTPWPHMPGDRPLFRLP
jgi:putative copper export protein